MRDVNVNDAVAFLVELGALGLLGTWAWQAPPSALGIRVLVVVVVVGVSVLLWGLFAAPHATWQVPALAVAVKVLVLGGSVVAAYAVVSSAIAATVWAVVVVVNTTLTYVGPFA